MKRLPEKTAAVLLSILLVAISLATVDAQAQVDSKYTSRKDYQAFEADKGLGSVDVAAFPDQIQKAYGIYSVRCSKCHPLARSINSNKEASAWMFYVKRMSRKPESGISPGDAKAIYKFLKYYQIVKDRQAKP